MSKKGFTLVELLATIALISILSGIAVIVYTNIVEKGRLVAFNTYEKTMYSDAMKLMLDALSDPDKASYFPLAGETKHLTLADMGTEPFNNPKNKNDLCPTSYVEVTRDDYYDASAHVDSLKYKICLICSESDYNVTGNSCLFIPEPTS